MANRSITVKELKIPISAVSALNEHQRYTYYLLGHIFNELMCLQKIIMFSVPKHGDIRTARLDPEIGQILLFFRLASGKVLEASQLINNGIVSRVLEQIIFPKLSDGSSRLEALNVKLSVAEWLIKIRNKLSFHYPSFGDWKDVTTPNADWIPDLIFMEELSGNVFYSGPENVARYWMFGRINSDDPSKGVTPLIDELIDLLTVMTSFLEDVLSVFIVEVLLNGSEKPRDIGKVSAPDAKSVAIPFWIHMPKRNK